ncbi:uncharacterized protein EV420DRAFT_1557961 [Desarmillaria tabescens]|uniref:Transmembrane protein n=1 Tax=Armillaria tabescens TaxID=1929756 RepID=A0AA39N0I7_ARMTA|nr:uncharacterized protein EV420DRAFT_1557961 [Desarmillaria tabescens]KAK0453003.1 hypothetical protein EV420DRAFT_1557961 [Desarmillaria tabescens]
MAAFATMRRSLKWKLEALYTRITLNRLTTIFFLFGFFHCFAQGTIQSLLFSVDSRYSTLLSHITIAANVPPANHTFFAGSTLRVCNFLPHNDGSCSDVFTINRPPSAMSIDNDQNITENNGIWRAGLDGSGFSIKASDDTVSVSPLGESSDITLSKICIQTLLLPSQDLSNFRRENLAFVFLQFWLFGISVLAMIQDSVPHLLAGIGARILLTAWSAYAIWRTHHLSSVYKALLSDPGTPCSVDFFPTYFSTRSSLEIPDLVLNLTALTIMIWTVLRVYAVQSYKCVGAPAHILRIHKFFMAIQACLQLEVYILPAGMGLWIDQLFNTYIKYISEHTQVYESVFIFYTVMVVPWMILGWYAIRYERKKWMFTFIFIGFVFLLCESIMFYSQVYQWTFVMWPNLACFTVSFMIVIVACIILGIVCLRNFDQGLAQYLNAESVLASSNFAPEVFQHREDMDIEKAPLPEFPVPLHVLKGSDELDRPLSTYFLPTLHADDTSYGGVIGVKKDRW